MKRKVILPVLLLSVASLTSCGGGGTTSVAPSIPPSSEEVGPQPGEIQYIRDAEVGSEHEVTGIVVQHVWTGQGTPYKTGFMLANDTGCIYIYGGISAEAVQVGEKVTAKGKKAYYVPQTDTGAAESSGYKGQLQLTEAEVISHDGGNHDIPVKAITQISHLDEVLRHDLTDDISNQLYRIKGRLYSVAGPDYTNYYLSDLNRVESINFYTQSNGKDYKWLDSYIESGEAVDMTFITINAKPGTALWRGLPVKVNGTVTVSDKEEAEYAADRALSTLLDSYGKDVTVDLRGSDEKIEDITFTYECDSELATISENGQGYSITFKKPESETKVTVKATATYNGTKATKTKDVLLGPAPTFDATSIAVARQLESNTEVTIQGVVGRKTYKSGTTDPLGAFIIDETGSIVVYNDASYMASLAKVQEGNKVVLKGTMDHYVAPNTSESGYTGDVQLRNVTLIYNDGDINEIPTQSIQETTVAWVASQQVDNNISSNIYKLRVKVSASYSNGKIQSYSLLDPTSDSRLSVYSQKSGSDFEWLTPYIDQEVVMYVGVQNLQLRSGSPNWRCCPISVVTAA